MNNLNLNKFDVVELQHYTTKKVNGGFLLVSPELLEGLLEAGKRIHESYTAIKSGLIDGWNECGCTE